MSINVKEKKEEKKERTNGNVSACWQKYNVDLTFE